VPYFGGAGASGSQRVQGVQFCREPDGTAPTSMGAINIAATQDFDVITDNGFRQCASGVTGTGGGSHHVIANNTTIM
jgi:hypothetical protein